MIDGQNLFDQSVKNNIRIYDDILKIVIDQEDDYVTSCLLHYLFLHEHFKLITIYVSKQQAMDAIKKIQAQE